ncbi:MAG: lipoate--protein ligase [Chloroflexi bacterium]|nr:lipoate--protein ligase [Chloroflexota bacterium]
MILIPNDCHQPQLNLAAEEYILNQLQFDEPVLFFFVNDPSIIIGRNQNTMEELDNQFVRTRGIQVVRRLSGGGAVYHDRGNLCFSFIFPGALGLKPNFESFTRPIVNALNQLGIPAVLSGRNDILVNGAKISGNAYYRNENGAVCHGTILFNTDLSMLSRALKPNREKLSTKGVRSVRTRVTNLKPLLPEIENVEALETRLTELISTEVENFQRYHLTESNLAGIEIIARKRYYTDTWNYGQSPLFNLRRRKRFSFGEVDARLNVEAKTIRSIRLFGDFFSERDPAILEDALTDVAFERTAIEERLQAIPLDSVLPDWSITEASDFFLGEKQAAS